MGRERWGRRAGLLALAGALGQGSCTTTSVFSCDDQADCQAEGEGGICQPEGYCSFPDDVCESGQRYGGYAGEGLAGKCVPLPVGSTGAPPGTSDSGPGSGSSTTFTGVDASTSTGPIVGDDTSTGEPSCGALGEGCCPGAACREGVCADSTCVACTAVVEAEEEFTCARRNDGQLYCWGADAAGQVGDGPPADPDGRWLPVLVLEGVTTVDLGAFHACAVTEASLSCWGQDSDGQLGLGARVSVVPAPTPVPTPEPFEEVAAGGFHTCARGRSGQAYCWGRNTAHQVGLAGTGDVLMPAAVPTLPPVLTVDTGGFHSCALDEDGLARCWGANGDGQLGHAGVLGGLPEPVEGLEPMQQLALGDYHSCARSEGGEVWCWGRNDRGQLAEDPMLLGSQQLPRMIPGLPEVVELVSGDDHVCGLTAGGEAWCWGASGNGQAGGPGPEVIEPTMLPVDSIVSLGLGRVHTCLVTQSSAVQCLGGNTFGQLGNGSMQGSMQPVDVPGICRG